LVVGDSTAEATGTGLQAWADANPALATVALSVARGCGVMAEGEVWMGDRWVPVTRECNDWLRRSLGETARQFQPDIALVMSTSWDVLDRRWPGGDRLSPGDAAYADHLKLSMTVLTNGLLDAGVGKVVWVRHPVADPLWLGTTTQADPARHEPIVAEMNALAAADPARVSVLDMAAWLDGAGWSTDHEVRPDGVHFAPAASTTMATDWLGPTLVAAALGVTEPPAAAGGG
jgi:hypothetical protein